MRLCEGEGGGARGSEGSAGADPLLSHLCSLRGSSYSMVVKVWTLSSRLSGASPASITCELGEFCADYFVLFPGTDNIIVPTSQGCCKGLDELPFVKGSILAHIKNFIDVY